MNRRITLTIAAVAVVCLAIAVPTASAGPKTDRAQNKKLKSQTKRLNSQSKSIKKNSTAINKGAVDVTKLNASAAAVGSAITALKLVADRADGNAKTVLDAAPAIIKGLTDLKTGLETAGAGLQGLSTAAAATEYGWIEETGPAPAGPTFHVTPDIPDAAQQGATSVTSIAPAAGNVTTRFGVRGNESDGNGTTDAASCVVTIINLATGTNTTSTFTPVPTKSTFQSVGGSPFAVIGVGTGGDVPVAGPSLAVAAGNQYTIRFACVDTSPPTPANPGG